MGRKIGRNWVEFTGFFKRDSLILEILIILNWIWFLPLIKKGAIMGDDIGLIGRFIDVQPDSFLKTVLFGYQGDLKYRPILNIVQFFTTKLFGVNYEPYFIVNLAINSLIIAALYHLLKYITNSKKLSALFCMMYIFCPFVYYAITQIYGIMEALCVLFLIIAIRYALAYYRTHTLNYLYISLFFSLLNIFTHERFIVLWPLYIILIVLIEKKQVVSRIIVVTIPFAFNYLFKTVILGLPFFQGTAGTSITFDFKSVCLFFIQGLLGVFGINIGPEYLNGYTFLAFSPLEKVITLVATIAIVLLLVVYINYIRKSEKQEKIQALKKFFLAACGIGATLLSGCITIRLEMRWLVAPYVIFLIYFCYITSKIDRKIWVSFAITAICVINIIIAFSYRENVDGLFFMRAMKIAQSVDKNVIQEYGNQLSDYTVITYGSNEMQWAISSQDMNIFDLKMDNHIQYQHVYTEQELQSALEEKKGQNIKVFSLQNDLTVRESIKYGYNIVQNLNTKLLHEVTPKTYADTPNGEGLFFEDDSSFTLLSGYMDTIHDLAFPPYAVIGFEVSMPLEATDGAELEVYCSKNGQEKLLKTIELKYGKIFPVYIELNNFESFAGELVFKVQSSTGDSNSDWVTIEDGFIAMSPKQ